MMSEEMKKISNFKISCMNRGFASCLLCVLPGLSLTAQSYLQDYRSAVKGYNQDIRSAAFAVTAREEMVKSAKSDFLPSVSGAANYQFAGNPSELSLTLPNNESLAFQGSHSRYGMSLSLAQPVYAGGALRAGYEKAKTERAMSDFERQRVTNDVLYQADVCYWEKVARSELVGVAEDFKASVARLVEVVRYRVDEGYTERTDLLMAEVKLNDAGYQLVQARNSAEVARMAMNSFAGVEFDQIIPTDSVIVALTEADMAAGTVEEAVGQRPERRMAESSVEVARQSAKISNSQFLPQLAVGVDGSYSSPGYDFQKDPDPNCVIYATLRVPIFEWGKRRNTRRVGKLNEQMAMADLSKVDDRLRLEVETARYTYGQAVEKVRLTESSLRKAQEGEQLAMNKYKEGSISIVEVINAQIYHQEARVNYIRSKLDAQLAKSDLDRATCMIDR